MRLSEIAGAFPWASECPDFAVHDSCVISKRSKTLASTPLVSSLFESCVISKSSKTFDFFHYTPSGFESCVISKSSKTQPLLLQRAPGRALVMCTSTRWSRGAMNHPEAATEYDHADAIRPGGNLIERNDMLPL